MTMIDLEDLKRWKAERIQHGNCSFDDMEALSCFIDKVKKYELTIKEKEHD